jgi:hypothetical protein
MNYCLYILEVRKSSAGRDICYGNSQWIKFEMLHNGNNDMNYKTDDAVAEQMSRKDDTGTLPGCTGGSPAGYLPFLD